MCGGGRVPEKIPTASSLEYRQRFFSWNAAGPSQSSPSSAPVYSTPLCVLFESGAICFLNATFRFGLTKKKYDIQTSKSFEYTS